MNSTETIFSGTFTNSVLTERGKYDWVSVMLWGYDDDNWWNNVITKEGANEIVVEGNSALEPSGRFYKVVFDVYKNTAKVYLLTKAEREAVHD